MNVCVRVCVGRTGKKGKRVCRPHFVVNEGNMIWILLLWLHTLHAKNEKVAAQRSPDQTDQRGQNRLSVYNVC